MTRYKKNLKKNLLHYFYSNELEKFVDRYLGAVINFLAIEEIKIFTTLFGE